MELGRRISRLEKKIGDLASALNLERAREEIALLEREMEKPDFWQYQEKASRTSRRLSLLKKKVERFQRWRKKIGEAKVILQLIEEEGAEGERRLLEKELEEMEKEIREMELTVFLSGPYDQNQALFSIHAGEGGTEAMDWTAMLFRMYTRFFARKKWPYEILEQTFGEEAGMKSVTLAIRKDYAYGFLKKEAGTHRLVRLSPFDADNLRHTSFARVEVLPLLGEKEVKLDPKDLKFEFFRSSGPGGQRVNKVSTAVRLIHIPTGIVVTCQAQRSQQQNRVLAEELLRAKLWQRQKVELEKEKERIKGEYQPASWGYQIRSYILHPYHLVKDLRTGFQTSDTEAVLDGQIEGFLEAELKKQI